MACTNDCLPTSSLDHSLAAKFGYDDVKTMKKDAQKRFSLFEAGILDQPCTKLLLVNVGIPPHPPNV